MKIIKIILKLQEKLYFKKEKKKKNDVTADMAQRESSIKCYVSTFSNIQMTFQDISN